MLPVPLTALTDRCPLTPADAADADRPPAKAEPRPRAAARLRGGGGLVGDESCRAPRSRCGDEGNSAAWRGRHPCGVPSGTVSMLLKLTMVSERRGRGDFWPLLLRCSRDEMLVGDESPTAAARAVAPVGDVMRSAGGGSALPPELPLCPCCYCCCCCCPARGAASPHAGA